jgi:F-type H+-transporting ATPase subunit delta
MTTQHDEKQRIRHYCEAIYRIAEAENALGGIAEQLYRLNELIESNEELATFLHETRIESEGKREALQRILTGQLHPTILNFLLLMIDNGRGGLIQDVAASFGEIRAEFQGALDGEVRTTAPLTTEEVERLQKELEKKLQQPVHLQQKIDPSVLGGLVVRVGEHVIDGSLRRRLEQLRGMILHGSEI